MRVKKLVATGFKSFARKTELVFDVPITSIVGPNGSGKSNVVESIRFVLGEQSMKSLRGKGGVDLIFKGSRQIGKMNRAQVLLTFDNSDRIFKLQTEQKELSLDFNEIEIGREVYADGTNKYTINGNEVRHKDILELIASVNIGSSGHHIISQGEADRLLSAHPRDRKMMLEEALGLKVYHYRLKETEKKLEKTRENMRESELLRREIAPHLKFLKKQVEKFEQAASLRIELAKSAGVYVARQRVYIAATRRELAEREQTLQARKTELEALLADLESRIAQHEQPTEHASLIAEKAHLQKHKTLREELLRKLGRIEGAIALLSATPTTKDESAAPIARADFEVLVREITALVDSADALTEVSLLKAHIKAIKEKLTAFSPKQIATPVDTSALIAEQQQLQQAIESEIASLDAVIATSNQTIQKLEEESAQARAQLREEERGLYEHRARLQSLVRDSESLQSRKAIVAQEQERLSEEERELSVLLGDFVVPTAEEVVVDPVAQETARRQMERLKIKLEELGGGSGSDVIREFEETEQRDQFLERELADLQESITKLEVVMADLKETLARDFQAGLVKINVRFAELFGTMFGGGKAELVTTSWDKRKKKAVDEGDMVNSEDEDANEKETGIDIAVALPRKKVSDLEMLSGGERSLTSIALLFALSQVNPPPFLVLDETDAALDEANSKRYGDMIETLSKSSQLIVVTHNRETMSRAHVLYGVTLGSDDSSKLLTVKLEDAVKIAK